MNKKINIGIYAHVDAGKTTLTEQLLFHTGAIKAAGKVDQGSTQTDSNIIEKERGISIFTMPTSITYKDMIINIIDTPGHVDFIAEVERSMVTLDAAILVISAKEGVQSHSKLLFSTLQKMNVPTLFFINKIDRIGVNIHQVLKEIEAHLTEQIVCLQEVKTQDKIEILEKTFNEEDILKIAQINPSVLEHYLHQSFESQMIQKTLKEGIQNCNLYPVIFGSALKSIGIKECLHQIYDYLPVFKPLDFDTPSGFCFKIIRSKNQTTRQAWIKLLSGSLETYKILGEDKITNIQMMINGKLRMVGQINPGDIALLTGMHHVKVGTTFNMDKPLRFPDLGTPTLKANVHINRKTLRYELLEALECLQDSDPYLSYELNTYNDDITINLFGPVQMEVIQAILKLDYNLDIAFDEPMVIYKESPKGYAEAECTMLESDIPFRAGIKLSVEPLPVNSGLSIVMETPLNNLKKPFKSAIEDGLIEALEQGLYGWPITDLQITIKDYLFDSVSSTPKDFRDLAPLVLFEALKQCDTKLLWPIHTFNCLIQSHLIGKVTSELLTMQSNLDTPVISEDFITYTGVIPVKTSMHYNQKIHEYTSGHGYFTSRYSHYEVAPENYFSTREFFKVDPSNRQGYIMSKQRVF